MKKNTPIYCFRATCKLANNFDVNVIPEWISVESDWQGYKISTVPWIANVAQVIGLLNIEDSPDGWISYLKKIGFQDIRQVSCEDMFEEKLYS